MIRAVLALLCLATPIWATQDGWPALFDVAGVAADDVLNVRAAPMADSETVGTLTPGARDIEVIRPNDALTWGLVNAGEATGWVSLAFLARQPGQWDGNFPAIRQCFGTEPFWSIGVEGPAMLLSTPDGPAVAGAISAEVAAEGRRDRFVYRATLFSADAGTLDAALMLRNGACSDGMSDRAYGIATDVLITDPDDTDGLAPTRLLSGCCTLAPASN